MTRRRMEIRVAAPSELSVPIFEEGRVLSRDVLADSSVCTSAAGDSSSLPCSALLRTGVVGSLATADRSSDS